MTPEQLSDRLVTFAVKVGALAERLPETRLGRHIAGQLVRCCTSPAAVYEEACAAESRADFIHKMSIVLKELRETRLWLRMIRKGEMMTPADTVAVLKESSELCDIIGRALVTAKRNTEKWRRFEQ